MSNTYENPYPSPDLEARFPFVSYQFQRRPKAEMLERAQAFHAQAEKRRSIRMFSSDPVPRKLIELAVLSASTAPSGAHKQPWTFAATQDSEVKSILRVAAEKEEQANYLLNRMNAEWIQAVAPMGTDHHKEYLEIAPWVVVLFEHRYERQQDGSTRKNYYVKESVGMAAGLFVAALQNMGLVTLTHTPSPMAFLRPLLGRPENERPFAMFPIGYPLEGVKVPDLKRKSLDEIFVEVGQEE